MILFRSFYRFSRWKIWFDIIFHLEQKEREREREKERERERENSPRNNISITIRKKKKNKKVSSHGEDETTDDFIIELYNVA